jgi:hypothetical protein
MRSVQRAAILKQAEMNPLLHRLLRAQLSASSESDYYESVQHHRWSSVGDFWKGRPPLMRTMREPAPCIAALMTQASLCRT